jgi:hypothetical protein
VIYDLLLDAPCERSLAISFSRSVNEARTGIPYTAIDRVQSKTTPRYTSHEFVAFLKEGVSFCPANKQIRIIMDKLSARKTIPVRAFLEQNPRARFTPTHSSWLNQVALWFVKIERDVIAHAILTSVSDLARKLRRYINGIRPNAPLFQWKYSDPARRTFSNGFTATGH